MSVSFQLSDLLSRIQHKMTQIQHQHLHHQQHKQSDNSQKLSPFLKLICDENRASCTTDLHFIGEKDLKIIHERYPNYKSDEIKAALSRKEPMKAVPSVQTLFKKQAQWTQVNGAAIGKYEECLAQITSNIKNAIDKMENAIQGDPVLQLLLNQLNLFLDEIIFEASQIEIVVEVLTQIMKHIDAFDTDNISGTIVYDNMRIYSWCVVCFVFCCGQKQKKGKKIKCKKGKKKENNKRNN